MPRYQQMLQNKWWRQRKSTECSMPRYLLMLQNKRWRQRKSPLALVQRKTTNSQWNKGLTSITPSQKILNVNFHEGAWIRNVEIVQNLKDHIKQTKISWLLAKFLNSNRMSPTSINNKLDFFWEGAGKWKKRSNQISAATAEFGSI